jgi:hypothetical protein
MVIRADAADGDLLAVQTATLFVLTDSGRILHENAPDRSPAPRLYLAGCASGNVVRIRYNVAVHTALAIERLAADEPPLVDPSIAPVHLDDYVRLLASEAPVQRATPGLIWHFPDDFQYGHEVTLVSSDTGDGDRLLARLADQGMSPPLAALGFASVSDFWPPWCAALHQGEIA